MNKDGGNMIKVLFKPFANFREVIEENELEIELNGDCDVLELLNFICESYELRDMIFENGDKIKEYVNVIINGRSISFLEGVKTKLAENDEVALFPPVAGG